MKTTEKLTPENYPFKNTTLKDWQNTARLLQSHAIDRALSNFDPSELVEFLFVVQNMFSSLNEDQRAELLPDGFNDSKMTKSLFDFYKDLVHSKKLDEEIEEAKAKINELQTVNS